MTSPGNDGRALQRLLDELGRLPGIGPKSAQRIAYHLLQADAEDARRLSGLRDEARSLVDELSALNETNAQLLKQELALIELYMSILSPEAGAEVYGDPARGRRPAGGASVAFDTRA